MEESRSAPMMDRDSEPWWDGLRNRRLLLQRSESCAMLRWPLRVRCNGCGSAETSWHESAGSGMVASWNVTWRSPDPHLEAPYVVLLVRLADQEDILMPGSYLGDRRGSDLQVGMPVEAVFTDVVVGTEQEPLTLLSWRPSEQAAA